MNWCQAMNKKPNLLIIGKGHMGKMLADFFASAFSEIEFGLLEDSKLNRQEKINAADVIMIAVDIKNTKEVIRETAELLNPEQALCDITSLKKEYLDLMMELHKGPVLGLHPMFGPGLNSAAGQKVVLCKGRGDDFFNFFHELILKLEMEAIVLPSEVHDRLMLLVQGLVHMTTFICGLGVKEMNSEKELNLEEALSVSSPVYEIELAIIGRLFSQSPELYADLILGNPYLDQLTAIFKSSFGRIISILENRDREKFLNEFSGVSASLDKYLSDAQHISDDMINFISEKKENKKEKNNE